LFDWFVVRAVLGQVTAGRCDLWAGTSKGLYKKSEAILAKQPRSGITYT